jgi:hypothetical protein
MSHACSFPLKYPGQAPTPPFLTSVCVFVCICLVLALTFGVVGSDSQLGSTVDLAVVLERNPLLACSVMEAVLHLSPDYKGQPSAVVGAACNNHDNMQHASTTCIQATTALPHLAKATVAASAAAAAGATGSGSSSKLEQKMCCVLVAAQKYAQYSAAFTTTAGSVANPGVMGAYYSSTALLWDSSMAALRALGVARS